ADEILAHRMVDADFSAHGAVHLREQGCWHLHDGNSAQVGRGSESGDITDDAAADGDNGARSICVRANQRIVDPSDCRELLVTLTVGNEDRLFVDGALQVAAMKAPDGLARDDEAPRRQAGRVQGGAQLACEPGSNLDCIAAARCSDRQAHRFCARLFGTHHFWDGRIAASGAAWSFARTFSSSAAASPRSARLPKSPVTATFSSSPKADQEKATP